MELSPAVMHAFADELRKSASVAVPVAKAVLTAAGAKVPLILGMGAGALTLHGGKRVIDDIRAGEQMRAQGY